MEPADEADEDELIERDALMRWADEAQAVPTPESEPEDDDYPDGARKRREERRRRLIRAKGRRL